MDSALWSKLPESLIDLVVARLPLKDILRLRCLNKLWSNFIVSHDFQLLFDAVPSKRFALAGLNRRSNRLTAWVVDDRPLCILPLPAFPITFVSHPVFFGDIVVASAGGLFAVCLRGTHGDSDKVYVGNPIRNVWRSLPVPPLPLSLPCFLSSRLSMEMDSRTMQYTLSLVSNKSMTKYSSASNLWQSTSVLSEGLQSPCKFEPPSFLRNFTSSTIPDDQNRTRTQNRLIFTAWKTIVVKRKKDAAAKGLQRVQCAGEVWDKPVCPFDTSLDQYEMVKYFSCQTMILAGGLRLMLTPKSVTILQQLLMVYDTAKNLWSELPQIKEEADFFCINRAEQGCMFVPSLTAMP